MIRKQLIHSSEKIIAFGITTLLLVMPFHAFISVTVGSIGIDRVLIQLWKELLILLMAVAWFAYCIAKRRITIKNDATNIFFLAIIALSLVVTLFVHPNTTAVLYGIKTNLVAISLFFVAQTPLSSKTFLKRNLHLIIIIPGLIVSLLAIAQGVILSPQLLEKIGYNAATINPRQIVDGSLSFYRAFATLGGPNQLGAYLIVPLVFCIVYSRRLKSWPLAVMSLPIMAGIFLSYSRSAWIGTGLAILLTLLIVIDKKYRLLFLSIAASLILVGGLVVYNQLEKNSRLENVLLHGSYSENQLLGSDQNRLQALTDATAAVNRNPLGHGLGAAGPASFRAEKAFISENWYLQIAYEIGILGLVLYLFAFTGLLGEFYRGLKDPMAASLFPITISILLMNLFLHTWADSTLVLIMFSLYGLYKGRSA